MKRYDHQPVQISVTPVEGPYLDTAYYLDRELYVYLLPWAWGSTGLPWPARRCTAGG